MPITWYRPIIHSWGSYFCINIHAKYSNISVITPAVGSELNICGYLTFFVNISNLAAVYVIPVKCTLYPLSIYLVYISFVFCICSLIHIMGKPKLQLSRQKRCSYIKKRRSHATPSQTLQSCLASIPQGTPKTTPPKRLLKYFPSKPEQATPHTSRECRKTLPTPDKSCDNEMQLNDDDGLQNLTTKLKDTQAFLNKTQLGDFLDKLCTVFTTGILPLDNICFRLFLDWINLFSTQDARSFRYQEQTLTWWYVLLKQHGEQILRTCGGLKFLGSQIDSDDHALNPSSAQVNFIHSAYCISFAEVKTYKTRCIKAP